MNWLDWVVIAILAFSTFQGLRYGLVASVAKLAGLLIGFGVAFTYYQSLAQYLSVRWDAEEKILPLLEGILKFWLPTKNTIPPTFPPGKITSAGVLTINQFNSFGDNLARMFTSAVLDALCFLMLLFVTAWAINIAGFIITKIADISLMGPLNRLGGLFFGAAKGIVIIMVVLTLISPFQRPNLLPGGSPGAPGTPSPRGNSFLDSKLLPYFEPLFKAINRPLPGAPLRNNERTGPVTRI